MEAMKQGRTGILSCPDRIVPGVEVPLSLIDKDKLSAQAVLFGLTSYTTLEQLCILSVQEALRTAPRDLSLRDSLMIFATTKGNIDLLDPEGEADLRVFLPEMAANVARYFDLKFTPLVVSNACVSGVLAVELGADLIRLGIYSHVVVVGADLVTPFVLSGFSSFKSISPQPCRPYDALRDGLSLGEAVATLILSGREPQTDRVPVFVLGGGRLAMMPITYPDLPAPVMAFIWP